MGMRVDVARNIFLFLVIALSIIGCTQRPAPKVKGPLSKNGMVSSAHPLATRTGVDVLKQGGNAFDAAIAVKFALAVVYPRAGNIGGGGFMVSRTSDGNFQALDFREKAPLASSKNMYLDEKGNVIPHSSLSGVLAAGVPGTVAGMWEIHHHYGTLPWEDLIQPAIEMAENGISLTPGEAESLNHNYDRFLKFNNDLTSFELKKDWKEGDIFRQPELANTLRRIRDEGKDGFYKGLTAQLMLKEIEKGGGIIAEADLDNYKAIWRKPLEGSYKDYRIISMPPPSSGGIALLQLMKGSESFDWKAAGHNSAASVHYMTELMRRVYADRAEYLGDPDFYDVPMEMLLDEYYLKDRFSDINPEQKTDSEDIKAGKVERIESFETTHFSIADKSGNAVAITTTLNSSYGCKVVVKGAGFFLNNEMDDFAIKPGTPNQFGLIGAEANSIEPGKRMLSSMTPTIIEKDGQLFTLVGTPGGSTIITAVYQTIMNLIEFRMSMQEAVNARKIHAQWLPDELYVENGAISPTTGRQLEEKGHILKNSPSLGRMNCILFLDNGIMEGAADTLRSEGSAMGLP